MNPSKYGVAQVKCAFFAWFDRMVPNQQQFFSVDMGESQEEREDTLEAFWHLFVNALLDVEETD